MRKPGGSSPGPARSCWPAGRGWAMTCSWVCRPTGPRPRCATRGSSTTRAGSWSIGGPSGRASSACTRWEMPPRSPSPTASRSRRRACSRTRRRSRRAGNSPRRWQARRAGRRDEPAGVRRPRLLLARDRGGARGVRRRRLPCGARSDRGPAPAGPGLACRQGPVRALLALEWPRAPALGRRPQRRRWTGGRPGGAVGGLPVARSLDPILMVRRMAP